MEYGKHSEASIVLQELRGDYIFYQRIKVAFELGLEEWWDCAGRYGDENAR